MGQTDLHSSRDSDRLGHVSATSGLTPPRSYLLRDSGTSWKISHLKKKKKGREQGDQQLLQGGGASVIQNGVFHKLSTAQATETHACVLGGGSGNETVSRNE